VSSGSPNSSSTGDCVRAPGSYGPKTGPPGELGSGPRGGQGVSRPRGQPGWPGVKLAGLGSGWPGVWLAWGQTWFFVFRLAWGHGWPGVKLGFLFFGWPGWPGVKLGFLFFGWPGWPGVKLGFWLAWGQTWLAWGQTWFLFFGWPELVGLRLAWGQTWFLVFLTRPRGGKGPALVSSFSPGRAITKDTWILRNCWRHTGNKEESLPPRCHEVPHLTSRSPSPRSREGPGVHHLRRSSGTAIPAGVRPR
jgi:hypothetical protein